MHFDPDCYFETEEEKLQKNSPRWCVFFCVAGNGTTPEDTEFRVVRISRDVPLYSFYIPFLPDFPAAADTNKRARMERAAAAKTFAALQQDTHITFTH